MSSSKRPAREGRAEWARRVRQWERSGKTAGAFGAEIGVNSKTLAYWRWKLRREAGETKRPRRTPSASGPSFVEVHAGVGDARLVLELRDGRRIVVPRGFDDNELRRLLATVEGA